jgi:hypothetical protein
VPRLVGIGIASTIRLVRPPAGVEMNKHGGVDWETTVKTKTSALLRLALVILATAISGFATSVHADVVALTGANSGQYSTVTEVAEFNAQTNTLSFTLTNTSAITQPGSTSTITGIGFDLPPAGNASASGLNGFSGMQAPSLSSTFTFSDAAFGGVPGFNSAVLDFGFLTGGSLAAGAVSLGLLPGESASFVVSGAAFAGFTEEQIANAIFVYFDDVPTSAGSGGVDVAAVGASSVPEPASALLIAAGLAGIAATSRRRRRG